MRFRTVFLIFGALAVLCALFVTDPDGGASTSMMLLALATGILAVAFAHLARKALHDYPEADMRRLFRSAAESPIGAGLALVALSITLSALLGLFSRAAHAADVRSYIPPAAVAQMPVLRHELASYWRDHPAPEVVAALIEHESCVTLTASGCWNSSARLKTSREEGAGLGQITRAFRADGSLRFDALTEMRQRNPQALAGLSWSTVYSRPDLQMRALVLQSKGLYGALPMVSDARERLAMADAAYNGGLGGLQSERRACGMSAGCDPGRWFGHVELKCLKSRAALYGKRSACDINRHHTSDVMLVRAPKYRPLFS